MGLTANDPLDVLRERLLNDLSRLWALSIDWAIDLPDDLLDELGDVFRPFTNFGSIRRGIERSGEREIRLCLSRCQELMKRIELDRTSPLASLPNTNASRRADVGTEQTT